MDKRAHMRHEKARDLHHEDAFHSAKHHKRSHALDHEAALLGVPEGSGHQTGGVNGATGDDATGAAAQEVAAAQNAEAQEEQNAQNSGASVQQPQDIGQAEDELQKVDKVIVTAEEKAGLPDSTKTTPEPIEEEPSDEEQEGNALMIALISLVVLIGAGAAAWSIYLARKVGAKKADETPLLEGEEGEGE